MEWDESKGVGVYNAWMLFVLLIDAEKGKKNRCEEDTAITFKIRSISKERLLVTFNIIHLKMSFFYHLFALLLSSLGPRPFATYYNA